MLKGKKYFNCIEDEAGVSEKVLIPITIKWEDKQENKSNPKPQLSTTNGMLTIGFPESRHVLGWIYFN